MEMEHRTQNTKPGTLNARGARRANQVRRWRFDAGCWMFLIFISGCVRFQPQPLSPAGTAAELESRSLTNAALKIFLEKNLQHNLTNWPATAWDFEMLTLAAFYCHSDLAVARAQWDVARAGIKTAGGRPNPTLSLVPGYDTTHSTLSPWFPAVSFDLPVETAGKRGQRIAVADHLSESARLNIATVAWQIRCSLRASLLDFLAAEQREALLARQVSMQKEIVQRLEQQVRAGALAAFEVFAPHLALQKLLLELAAAESQRAGARAQLATAIGVSKRALAEVTLSSDLRVYSPPREDLTSAAVRRSALQGRTDILGGLAEYAATEAALQGEIAKQYPDVHLSPGYQYDQGDNKWSLGITFELPVLNQNQGPIAEAVARRAEAAARFNALQAKVLGEIERAVEVFHISEKNSGMLQLMVETQNRQLDSISAQFKAGAVDQLELLNAQFEFANAQLVYLEGEIKLQQAAAELEQVVQRPVEVWSSSVEPRPVAKSKKEKL
jgi:outer membrane protein TolC